MYKYIKFFTVIFLIHGCINPNQIEQARIKADNLLNNISSGNAYDAFPEKYFPRSQTELLLNELSYKCDFANRKGNFINDFYQKERTDEQVSFIYEFYLKCDSIRFILTYKLGQEPELIKFQLQPIEKENDMITKPERRLKF